MTASTELNRINRASRLVTVAAVIMLILILLDVLQGVATFIVAAAIVLISLYLMWRRAAESRKTAQEHKK